MANANLRLVAPNKELRTVTLRRRSNSEMGRDREHLTEHEIERLIKAAKSNRWGQRDATMVLIGFRHGLRVSELCGLQWSSIEFKTGNMHVRRAKGGQEATHPLLGDELRALRELKRQSASPFVFSSERGGPFTTSGFAKLLERAGNDAKIGFTRSILTCFVTPAATRWRIRGSIHEHCRPISATDQSIRRRAMRRWHREGSRTFGGRRSLSARRRSVHLECSRSPQEPTRNHLTI
jgi:integrase